MFFVLFVADSREESRQKRYSKTKKENGSYIVVPTFFLDNSRSLESTNRVLFRSVCVFRRKNTSFVNLKKMTSQKHIKIANCAKGIWEKRHKTWPQKLRFQQLKTSCHLVSHKPWRLLFWVLNADRELCTSVEPTNLLSDSHTNPTELNNVCACAGCHATRANFWHKRDDVWLFHHFETRQQGEINVFIATPKREYFLFLPVCK